MAPFLKWAGGKRWLFDQHFIASLPPYRRYIEPFLGGGAGFFALKPRSALLSDANAHLIELYREIRDNYEIIVEALFEHQKSHCYEYYYSIRANVPEDSTFRAARLLYLNRTCWNGLYRLNRSGKFNVPMGTKTSVLLATDDFEGVSRMLRTVELRVADFEETISVAEEGDLIFADPPYTVKHDNNGFVKYNENIFSWRDQERLKDSLVLARERGASIVLTNANHSSVIDLYADSGETSTVSRASVISGKVAGRSAVSELLVRM